MTEQMTSKERWLAAIHMQPVDRLPFWPKLDGAYPKVQDAPFRDMELDAIQDWIGSDNHKGIAGCTREVRKHTSVETTQKDGTTCTVFRTPSRELQTVRQFDEPSNAWHPMEFPVKSVEDVLAMTQVFEDVTVELDPDGLEKARGQAEAIGEDALTTDGIGESPLMHWVEWLAGVENAHFLLMDHQFEAFTSPTLGNTSLLDGRRACPDTCLIGGTNAMLWTTTANEIIAKIEKDLDELPHHRGIVVTSAGVMPPLCKPETIKQVCEWVKQYPARMA